MNARQVVLFAGGGTAGHVFPAVAVAQELAERAPQYEPVFIGTEGRLEGRLVPEAGFRLYHIDVLPVPRRLSVAVVRVPGALRDAVGACTRLISDSGAVAAVTFGGYVSFPLSRAAYRADLPLVVHEQNAVPGLANRIASRWAERTAVSFPGSADRFPRPERVAVTGNPVRRDILHLDRAAARAAALAHFRLDPDRRTILVFGGSQGAQRLNRTLVDSYPHWPDAHRIQLLHAAGRALFAETTAAWERARRVVSRGPLVCCVDFIDDMAAAYACADIVICRAGATSIAELTVLGQPAVLVPYPHATADHQRHNAEALARAGAARVLLDRDLSPQRLVAETAPLLDDERRAKVARAARAFGRRDAAANVVRLVVEEVARSRRPIPVSERGTAT